jgi:hypothetical protein
VRRLKQYDTSKIKIYYVGDTDLTDYISKKVAESIQREEKREENSKHMK